MRRRKQNKFNLESTYRYRYIAVTIIGLLLFTYVGQGLLADISSQYFAKDPELVQEDQVEDDNDITEENIDFPDGELIIDETEQETIEVTDEVDEQRETDDMDEQIEDLEQTVDLEEEPALMMEELPALAELVDLAENVNGNEDNWKYEHVTGGGTLTLLKTGDFILQNNVEGTSSEAESISIHIIVAAGASDSNIMLNNLNISRPARLNNGNAYLSVSLSANAPLFIEAENTTIMLLEGTNNYIDATDGSASFNSQRSAIYLYGSTTDTSYTLDITGKGQLSLNDAGINTYVVEGATSNITLTDASLKMDVNGTRRTAIGSVSVGSDINFGNLDITIKSSDIIINTGYVTNQNTIFEVQAAAIGIGLYRGNMGNVRINISGDANVIIDMNLQNLDQEGVGGQLWMRGAAIGTGSLGGCDVASLLIEIVDNPTVVINQLIKGLSNIGNMYYHAAAIGAGHQGSFGAFTINISGGDITSLQVVDVGRTSDNGGSSTMRPSNIGLGFYNIISGSSGLAEINISAGTINLEKEFLAYDNNGVHVVGGLALTGSGVGTGSNSTFVNLDINLTGGNINIKLNVKTDNPALTLDANGAGIGAASGEGSGVGSTININIKGEVNIDVQGGYSGIGAAGDSKGTIMVNISKDGGHVPTLIVTARRGEAIREIGGTGVTDGVIFSQFDLGEGRRGENWRGWDDEVSKEMLILREKSDSETGREILRRINFIGGIQGVAYTLPSLTIETETRVKMIFSNEEEVPITGYFRNINSENRILIADNSIQSEEVMFEMDVLPALWTLYDEGNEVDEDAWHYNPNTETLRLKEVGFFILHNNEEDDEFVERVPINIVVESTATGSELVFDNIDLIRGSGTQSSVLYHEVDSEQISPFTIKAQDITISLNIGSKNKIDGNDPLLGGPGYRTAMYMYADNSEKASELHIKEYNRSGLFLDDFNLGGTTNFADETSLATVNGGINALGVDGATVNMILANSSYDLNAGDASGNHGVAFGSGFTSEPIPNFNLNLSLDNLESIRAIGHDVAIGHNENSGSSNLNVDGQFILEAFAFSSKNAIPNAVLPNSSIAFTTTLAEADNWESVIMFPYRDGIEEETEWELLLPASTSYLGKEQPLSVVYSNSEFDNYGQVNPFERMSLRIVQADNINFLANVDGTGSTLAVIPAGSDVVTNNGVIPSSGIFDLSIPSVILNTNYVERTLNMPETETVRQVSNDSELPLSMSFGGYTLTEGPDEISFAESEEEFDRANGAEVQRLFLELLTTGSGDVNFYDGDDNNVQTLIPRFDEEETKYFTEIAVLRGINESATSTVNLAVQGKFTEAMTKSANNRFVSTIYLRWSLREFVQFDQ